MQEEENEPDYENLVDDPEDNSQDTFRWFGSESEKSVILELTF